MTVGRLLAASIMAVFISAAGGCTHIAGTAYESGTTRPLAGAILSIGHPGGIGVFEQHVTDSHGKFDFFISPTDENHLYVRDGESGPNAARRVDRSEISDHMKLAVRRGGELQ